MGSFDVKQIYEIVNDATADALSGTLTTFDGSDFISMGKALAQYDAYDGWFKSIAKRIAEVIYFIRQYSADGRNVLRDEHEYGAFVEKVYYTMPDASEDTKWKSPDSSGEYTQNTPYEVKQTLAVETVIYGGRGAWTYEWVRPIDQIKNAFLSAGNMAGFIDGMFIAANNKYELDLERLVAGTVNVAMASAIRGGQSRNLLAEYNTNHPSNTLTVAEALESADFLKYASKEIKETIDYMSKISTFYNAKGYETFTDREHLVVEVLSKFASATDTYLQADTYHNEMTALPNYSSIPYWQTPGDANHPFEDVSTIDVHMDDWESTSPSDDGNTEQSGIICFLRDTENCACYFGNRKSWEFVNVRDDVMVHGEKALKGYAIDPHANAFVFYIAEE